MIFGKLQEVYAACKVFGQDEVRRYNVSSAVLSFLMFKINISIVQISIMNMTKCTLQF